MYDVGTDGDARRGDDEPVMIARGAELPAAIIGAENAW
jgi:hypothetical protein